MAARRFAFAARRYRKKNLAYWSGRKKIAPSNERLALQRKSPVGETKRRYYKNGGRERMREYRRRLSAGGGGAASGDAGGDAGGTGADSGGGVGGGAEIEERRVGKECRL